MKRVIMFALLIIVISCGKESSPEGRSKIRDTNLQEQIDSLKLQNKLILQEIKEIKKELNSDIK